MQVRRWKMEKRRWKYKGGRWRRGGGGKEVEDEEGEVESGWIEGGER